MRLVRIHVGRTRATRMLTFGERSTRRKGAMIRSTAAARAEIDTVVATVPNLTSQHVG